MQFSFKFNMKLNSLKSSLARCYSTKQSIKSSQKNHYDTLKITPYATQNQVKSAYYKLTLQYHPDKNKSEYAKQKFQDILEAYEVLSNHEQRKNYDRHLMLRRPVSTTAQEPISQYKDKVYSGTSRIYNFDAWVQAHYGDQMHAQRARRKIYEQYKQMEELHKTEKNKPLHVEMLLVILTLIIFLSLFREKLDVPVSKTEKDIQEKDV